MIAPYRVVWNNQSSYDLDIWAEIAFDSDQGATSSFLNREAVSTEHYDGSYRRIPSYKYNEILTPRITFVKQNYTDFTPEENRKILSWLTSSDKVGWLEVYHDDSNVVSYRLYGNFITVEQYKLANGRVVGFEAEFESSNPYAWSQKIEVTKQIVEPTEFTLTCNSDEYNKLIYPKVTINFSGDNVYLPINENPMVDQYQMMHNVIYIYNDKYYINIDGNKNQISGIFSSDISNQTSDGSTLGKYYYFPGNKTIYKGIAIENDDGTASYDWEVVTTVGAGVEIKNSYTINKENKTTITELVGNALNEEVILDGANKVLASSISSNNAIGRIIGDDFNWVWMSIAEGENKFTVTGNCTIKFEWIEPRKVGNL